MKNLKEQFQKIKLLVLDSDGVMTSNRVLVSEDGKESVFCNRDDGLGIEMLKKRGVEVVFISKETNKIVKTRCEKLKIKYWSGVDEKIQLFLREIEKRNLGLKNKNLLTL